MNIVVIRGTLSRSPDERLLASGSRLANLDVTTPTAEGRNVGVPVAWFDPSAELDRLEEGDEVVVVGTVARRFFAVGGSTQSRTEVVASTVVRPSQRRRVERAVAAACEEAGLTDLLAAALVAG